MAANWDAGWGSRDAFTAEFCALGGDVAAHVGVDFFDPKGSEVARVPRDVDGVAVFASGSSARPGSCAGSPGGRAIPRSG